MDNRAYQPPRVKENQYMEASDCNTGHNYESLDLGASRGQRSAESSGSRQCKTPPWWGWVLFVLCLCAIGGLVAVFVLFSPLLTGRDANADKSGSRDKAKDADVIPTNQEHRDCKSLYDNGYVTSGIYGISPDGKSAFNVWCEQAKYGGGWTVIQRRVDDTVHFYQPWDVYKTGFGDLQTDFWLGNDKIHALTVNEDQSLMFILVHPNGTRVEVNYGYFWIENEAQEYRMHVLGFSTSAVITDMFGHHNNHTFVTKDRDNSDQCAEKYQGGWWYLSGRDWCDPTNLNGVYGENSHRGLCWWDFNCIYKGGPQISLREVHMMVRGK